MEGKPLALHSRKKSEMVSALAEFDTNEDFWPSLVQRISDGEFVSSIAEGLKVNHSILRNWIRGNKKREEELQVALEAGKKARMERVVKSIYEVATTAVTEPATRMEVLRAAELMLKSQTPDENKGPRIGSLNITFVAANNGQPAEKLVGEG